MKHIIIICITGEFQSIDIEEFDLNEYNGDKFKKKKKCIIEVDVKYFSEL